VPDAVPPLDGYRADAHQSPPTNPRHGGRLSATPPEAEPERARYHACQPGSAPRPVPRSIGFYLPMGGRSVPSSSEVAAKRRGPNTRYESRCPLGLRSRYPWANGVPAPKRPVPSTGDPGRPKSGSQRTLRWRETDSNHRFLGEFRRDLDSPWRRGSGLRGRSPQPWVEFARDSPLEGSGFELSVPRQIGNGFEALSETGPIGCRRSGLIRAVAGFAEYPRLKGVGRIPAYPHFRQGRW
jgi:hypothetical protein